MKILCTITAALLVSVLVASCSHPTTPPSPNPSSGQFTVTASIDGTLYSAGATMTVAPFPPSNSLVDLKSTSGSRSLELVFIFPTTGPFPVNINQPKFAATYTEGGALYTDSLGSATVKVNSFNSSYSDTIFSADFSFIGKGGAGAFTVKNITAGTVR